MMSRVGYSVVTKVYFDGNLLQGCICSQGNKQRSPFGNRDAEKFEVKHQLLKLGLDSMKR